MDSITIVGKVAKKPVRPKIAGMGYKAYILSIMNSVIWEFYKWKNGLCVLQVRRDRHPKLFDKLPAFRALKLKDGIVMKSEPGYQLFRFKGLKTAISFIKENKLRVDLRGFASELENKVLLVEDILNIRRVVAACSRITETPKPVDCISTTGDKDWRFKVSIQQESGACVERREKFLLRYMLANKDDISWTLHIGHYEDMTYGIRGLDIRGGDYGSFYAVLRLLAGKLAGDRIELCDGVNLQFFWPELARISFRDPETAISFLRKNNLKINFFERLDECKDFLGKASDLFSVYQAVKKTQRRHF